jgi:hypothetical protein
MNTITSLSEKINNAKTLDFGTLFSQCIELFKKVWVQGLVMLLLTIAFIIPFYIIIYLPLIAMGFFEDQMTGYNNDPELIFMIPFILLILVFSIFAMIVTFGMKASFYRICKIKDLNEAKSDDYFYYLKRPHLGKVITLSLMSFGISLLAVLLCVLPIIYVVVPIALINVVFAFNPEMKASDIVKASFNLGNKKWLITFGLMIIAGLLAEIVGFMLCFIGIFATASFAYLPAYFIYKESVGFEDSYIVDSIEEIDQ